MHKSKSGVGLAGFESHMLVVSGSSGRHIASGMAELLGCEHHSMEARRFPDSEGYFRVPPESIDAMRAGPVVLVSNAYPDSGIIETMLLLEAIRDVREGRLSDLRDDRGDLDAVGPGVYLAVPYFGYSRQDKRFKRGEAVSAQAIGHLLAGRCDGIAVLDLHAPSALENLQVPVVFASSMREIAQHLQSTVRPDFILSPDKGAIQRARFVADEIGCEFSYLEKTRIDAHTITHAAKDLDVEGTIVAIVDDMISTGGTICRASDALREQGAVEVHAACTHGLFTAGAISRLDSHVDGVHATDSLLNPRGVIPAADALTRAIRSLLSTSD